MARTYRSKFWTSMKKYICMHQSLGSVENTVMQLAAPPVPLKSHMDGVGRSGGVRYRYESAVGNNRLTVLVTQLDTIN